MLSPTAKMLVNKRLLAILVLGFSSGLPIALTGATLQAWFTQADVALRTIGTLSLLGVPYTLKFLWAPLMDHYGFSRLGKRKSWIMLMQAGLVTALLLLSQMDPAMQAGSMGVVALAITFFSASQDISINAYTTDVLIPEERGLGAAYSVFAYRVALLVSGGLALIYADYFGWKRTYELMALLVLLSMLPTYMAPRTPEIAASANNLYQTTKQAILDMLQREKIVLLLLFIILYKLGDALALSLITNFLLHGLGFSLTEVGLAYKVVSFVAVVLGGFAGGLLLTRWNVYLALLIFGIAQAFSNLMFALLALVGKHFYLMVASVFVENFCSGLSTAALLAFMMSLCDHRYTASQFALFSAVASLGRVFLGPIAALMVEHLGWIQFYIWSFVICFPGIFLLTSLKGEVMYHAHATAD
ncbi:MAG: MFS transporter [Gammaproteobacteria bacterium]|nr:MFS transporter [Gammaproteobacteria bacterium]MCW5582754.1 MFS transporter [Gammaproteobacteria bacterium]